MITGHTRVCAVFGDPIGHSLSPLMHAVALKALELDWVYVPAHVRPPLLKSAVESIRALDLAGVNVTIPHKVAVMEHLDELSAEAELIGAVNTIVHRPDGTLVGHNTDGLGFYRSLVEETGTDVVGRRVLVLGAGGAARAIAVQLGLEGADRIDIVNRTVDKAEAIAKLLVEKVDVPAGALSLDDSYVPRLVAEADIVINTTSVGMYPHHDEAPLIGQQWMRSEQIVCDIVYRPLETALLRAARAQGAFGLDGLGMLAYQGAVALELWSGKSAPAALMKETLRKHLGL